jgi:GT2 family glycosyltransferase/glycosyltransferase involved in cell wall biosynthesis
MDLREVPFDQYQRYEICKRLIDEFAHNTDRKLKVLDIGGFFIGPNNGEPLLPGVEFLPKHDVLVIDTIEASVKHYMKSDGRNLPFEDNSFDFVIANDVFEHVPPNDRERFMLEIIRVSKNYVVMNNPYYTPKNALAEKILYEYIINVLHSEHKMLQEHLLYGLPRIDFMRSVLEKNQFIYSYYFSGDIDNWIHLMLLRHELISRKINSSVVNYLDSFYNEFHFENEMNLSEGYRATFIIAKSDENRLINQNFFERIDKTVSTAKVKVPISSIIELYKLKNENEQKGKLDSFYYQFSTITPRLSNGSKVSQSFKCNLNNLYKIGFLAATFKEKLSGIAKITLKEKESSKIIHESIIQLEELEDNNWFYTDFVSVSESMDKTYEVSIEQLSNQSGFALYCSDQNDYGELCFNGEVIPGGLSIKIFVREMSEPENHFFIIQSYKSLQERFAKKEEQLLEYKKEGLEESEKLRLKLIELQEQSKELEHEIRLKQLEFEKSLAIKDLEMTEKNLVLTEKSQMLNEVENRLTQKELDLSNKESEISFKNALILNIENELNIVYGTLSWRLTKPLRWVTQKKRQLLNLFKPELVKNDLNKNNNCIINIETNNRSSFTVREVQLSSAVINHKATVDIIICVHNALDDVKRCLESVLRYTKTPYSLILVDDGSAEETAKYLSNFALSQGVTLIRNEIANGYTLAANQGLRQSTSDYALLLNSDTIVTPGWLDRMVECAESGTSIGMVGPLSNTASWQSIPRLEHEGDWADNDLPRGISVSDMALLVAENSARLYPRISFLNGFCLMIKRGVINQIGYFDEDTFGRGYGEENDYCLRATKAGWELAVADDCYVYHAQSKSYSHERRKALAKQADMALVKKHGQQIISDGVQVCRFNRVLEGIRSRSEVMYRRSDLIREGLKRWEGLRILFILPIMDAGGGGNVVIQEAESMLSMGVDVRILNFERHRHAFENSYSNYNFKVPVVYAKNEDQISQIASRYDAVIATAYHSVQWLGNCLEYKTPIRGYYVQDFEPYFFDKGSNEYQVALDSYKLYPDLIRITKTNWNLIEVKNQVGVECKMIGPSVNIDLFRPRPRFDANWPQRPLRIAAMIRPSTPRRNPKFTMEILKEVSMAHGPSVEIILFGCSSEDSDFLDLPSDFAWRNSGVLTSQQLASLFNEVDVFVDFSSFQAMGLTAMEAMACGAAVIVPKHGGANSFLRNEENGLIVDSTSREECLDTLNRLILDEALRTRIQRKAIFDICQYTPENAAYNILEAIFG